MNEGAFIVGAMRTPVAPRGGKLREIELHQLGAAAVKACLKDAGIEPEEVDELVAGNCLGSGGNPARLIALEAGLPERVAGLTVDRQCCSGLDALLIAEALIAAGQAEIVIAGGAESYSRRPARFRAPSGGHLLEPYDQAAFTPWPDKDPGMAEAADGLGVRLGIPRSRQDEWAIESHRKALSAQERLANEIAPVEGASISCDSFARKLSPGLCARAKSLCGSVTHANSAVAADGAAFCAVVSERVRAQLDTAYACIVGGRTVGGDPLEPGLAPVRAASLALEESGIRVDELNAAEIMEAYSVQAIACVEGTGIDTGVVNLGGGSLARGHPIGASGAILAVRLVHEIRHRRGVGLAAIAAAGGLGTAVVLCS